MRVILFFFTITFAFGPVVAQRATVKQNTDVAQYIGLRYGPSLPHGLKSVGGSLVSSVGDKKEYGIAEIHRGATKMLWFERLTHRDEKGLPYWEVTDVMVLPRTTKKQVFVYAFCLSNDQPDGEIAALADNDPGAQYFTRVHRAWRANRQTGKFESLPTKGIKCENPGFGV